MEKAVSPPSRVDEVEAEGDRLEVASYAATVSEASRRKVTLEAV